MTRPDGQHPHEQIGLKIFMMYHEVQNSQNAPEFRPTITVMFSFQTYPRSPVALASVVTYSNGGPAFAFHRPARVGECDPVDKVLL